jgi:hypothetical protein
MRSLGLKTDYRPQPSVPQEPKKIEQIKKRTNEPTKLLKIKEGDFHNQPSCCKEEV